MPTGQAIFGSGNLYAVPLTTYDGTAITVPTPVQFGTLQSGSIDFSWDEKELHGQRQFAAARGRGKGKCTGKATFGTINGTLLNSIVFGQTLASGAYAVYNDMTGTAIPATPFTITVTPPNSGVFATDLGVVVNGVPLVRVASEPTTGQYSVTVGTGAYLFAAADTGSIAFINYQYTATSATSGKITLTNPFMGYNPTFRVDLSINYAGKLGTITLNCCTSNKLSFATKLDDFAIPEFDFSAMEDSSHNLGTIAFTDK